MESLEVPRVSENPSESLIFLTLRAKKAFYSFLISKGSMGVSKSSWSPCLYLEYCPLGSVGVSGISESLKVSSDEVSWSH